MDIVEYNPFYDNRGQQTARLLRRVMLQLMTGIAMKKEGMEPDWVNLRISGDPSIEQSRVDTEGWASSRPVSG